MTSLCLSVHTSEFLCPVRSLGGREVLWGGRTMPTPERRYLKRSPCKQRASLVVNLEQNQKRFPCLVLDSSEEGFRLRGSFRLRRGQVVEIVLDEDPLNAVRCTVVWVGKAGSKQEGEIGLQTV
jgi:PilZ domain